MSGSIILVIIMIIILLLLAIYLSTYFFIKCDTTWLCKNKPDKKIDCSQKGITFKDSDPCCISSVLINDSSNANCSSTSDYCKKNKCNSSPSPTGGNGGGGSSPTGGNISPETLKCLNNKDISSFSDSSICCGVFVEENEASSNNCSIRSSYCKNNDCELNKTDCNDLSLLSYDILNNRVYVDKENFDNIKCCSKNVYKNSASNLLCPMESDYCINGKECTGGKLAQNKRYKCDRTEFINAQPARNNPLVDETCIDGKCYYSETEICFPDAIAGEHCDGPCYTSISDRIKNGICTEKSAINPGEFACCDQSSYNSDTAYKMCKSDSNYCKKNRCASTDPITCPENVNNSNCTLEYQYCVTPEKDRQYQCIKLNSPSKTVPNSTCTGLCWI